MELKLMDCRIFTKCLHMLFIACIFATFLQQGLASDIDGSNLVDEARALLKAVKPEDTSYIHKNNIISWGVDAKAVCHADCSGLIALPGFVDVHTHLREPGFEASETIVSGSRSAAAGGRTGPGRQRLRTAVGRAAGGGGRAACTLVVPVAAPRRGRDDADAVAAFDPGGGAAGTEAGRPAHQPAHVLRQPLQLRREAVADERGRRQGAADQRPACQAVDRQCDVVAGPEVAGLQPGRRRQWRQ